MNKKWPALLTATALLVGSISACSGGEAPAPSQAPSASSEASYTATQKGFGGDVTVTVTFDGGKIVNVQADGPDETSGVGSIALEQLPDKLVESQSLRIDAVTGATVTSNAIFAAVKDCIAQAGLSEDDFMTDVSANVNAETVRYETDVVIVGSGLSGSTAAVAASEGGLDVIVLEKLPMTGGSAKSSKGSFMVYEGPENESFRVQNEDDTLEAALARWKEKQDTNSRVESNYPDYDRLSKMLLESSHTLQWMENHGASYTSTGPISIKGMAMLQVEIDGDETKTPAGRLLAKLSDIATENGAKILTSTPATELILDGDKVVGVKATSPDGPVEVYAKAVILACGGYISNQEMLHEYIPQLYSVTGIGVVGNTGDGIAMAKAAGAVEMDGAWLVPSWIAPAPEFVEANPLASVFQESSSPIEESESSYYRLVVNKDGERFQNEAAQYAKQVLDLTYLGENPYWALYDNLSATVAEIADSGLETGKVLKADTLEELAEKAGFDKDTFLATVNRYNEMCAAGEDTDFGKDADHLIAYGDNGPYYLVEMVPAGSDTIGGIQTNYDFQALREDGSAIDGLYAVGSMSNGAFYNQYYFSGSALTFAATGGRLVGTSLAETLK